MQWTHNPPITGSNPVGPNGDVKMRLPIDLQTFQKSAIDPEAGEPAQEQVSGTQ